MRANHIVGWTRILVLGLVMKPLSAFAGPPARPVGTCRDAPRGMEMHMGAGPMPAPGFANFPGNDGAWDFPPRFLEGVTLTDDQHERVFGILYAAVPAIREQAKALHKAREALEELVTTAQYEQGRVATLTDAAAKADSQLAVIRARSHREIYLLLTPEQRVQITERRRNREAHGSATGGRAQ